MTDFYFYMLGFALLRKTEFVAIPVLDDQLKSTKPVLFTRAGSTLF